MLAEAKKEAERIIKEARERQERLVCEEEVTKPAERAAEDIVEDARAREREIRLGAEDYADEILNTLEVNLSKFIAAVQRGRERLQGKDEPAEVALARGCAAASPAPRRRVDVAGSWSARADERSAARLQVHQLQVRAATLLARAGVLRARAPRQARCARWLALLRWGPTPAAGLRGLGAIRYPDRAGDRRRARHAHLRASSHRAHQRAGATGCAAAGVGEGDGVAIMCRNHRGFVEATVACVQARRERAVSEHAVRRPADRRRAATREDPAAVDLRRGVRRPRAPRARRGASASSPGASRQRQPRLPTLEQLIAAGAEHASSRRRPRTGRVVILTSGTTGTPKGASRNQPRLARAGRGAVLEDPAAGARDDADRRAAVSLLGLRALHARRCALVLDARAAAPLRPRGDAAGGRPAPRRARSPSCR